MDAAWPVIAVRLALYLTLGGLFGLAAFCVYALRGGERQSALSGRTWLVGLSAAAILLSVVSLQLLAASMAGNPAWPIDRAAITSLVSDSSLGRAWEVRMVALAVATLTSWLARDRTVAHVVVAVASGVALGTLAWTGHGAMDEGRAGWTHLGADILHLLAAGAWLGALLGLVLLVTRPSDRLDATHLTLSHRALKGFSVAGTIIVGAIAVTGLVNTWFLVGPDHLDNIWKTAYGQLLLAKLTLFVAMLGLASLNRHWLTPGFARRIGSGSMLGALRILRFSLAVEGLCSIGVLAAVAWLGTLEPPVSGS